MVDEINLNVLTARQRDVFELVRRNLQDKEIANRLGISPSAVKHHMRELFRKFSAVDRREIILRFGIFDTLKARN